MASDLLPFERLWPLLSEHARQLPAEPMDLSLALGRVLRQAPAAAWDLPRFDNSAMDGYAVQSADVAAATADDPVTLEIVADAFAGPDQGGHIAAGQAARIGTGGVIPDGADAIVPVENARVDGALVHVLEPSTSGRHIRRRAEEIGAGDPVLAPGRRLTAYSIAALAAAGVDAVQTSRPPRIQILVTGNELVQAGQVPGPGQIVETNGRFLAATLSRLLNVPPPPYRIVPDREGDLAAALNESLAESDLVISTGGVSVGERDLIKDVAEANGVDRILWRVAQKPGKPVYLGRKLNTLLLGLPGNPAAVGVAVPVMIAPLLASMEGANNPLPPRFRVSTTEALPRNMTRTQFRWATLIDGQHARPLQRAGSHMLGDLAVADVLLIVEPGTGDVEPLSQLDAISLAGL